MRRRRGDGGADAAATAGARRRLGARRLRLRYGGADPFEAMPDSPSGGYSPYTGDGSGSGGAGGAGGAGGGATQLAVAWQPMPARQWARVVTDWATTASGPGAIGVLPAHLISSGVLSFLDARSLVAFGATCRAAAAASDAPPLWASLMELDFSVPAATYAGSNGSPRGDVGAGDVGRSIGGAAALRLRRARMDYGRGVIRFRAQRQLLAANRARQEEVAAQELRRTRMHKYWVFAVLPPSWTRHIDEEETRVLGVGVRFMICALAVLIGVVFPTVGAGVAGMCVEAAGNWFALLGRTLLDVAVVVSGALVFIHQMRDELVNFLARWVVVERAPEKARALFALLMFCDVGMQRFAGKSVVVSVLATALWLLMPLLRWILPLASVGALVAAGVAPVFARRRAAAFLGAAGVVAVVLVNEVACRWTGNLTPWRLWVLIIAVTRILVLCWCVFFIAVSCIELFKKFVNRSRGDLTVLFFAPIALAIGCGAEWLHSMYWLGAVWEYPLSHSFGVLLQIVRLATWVALAIGLPWGLASQLPYMPWSAAVERDESLQNFVWFACGCAIVVGSLVHWGCVSMGLTGDDLLSVFVH